MVEGNVNISGILYLNYFSNNGTNITLITTNNGTISGQFDKIIITTGDQCQEAIGTPDYSEQRFGMLINTSPNTKDPNCQPPSELSETEKNFNNNVIIISVVVIGVVVLVAVVTAVVLKKIQLNNKAKRFSMESIF